MVKHISRTPRLLTISALLLLGACKNDKDTTPKGPYSDLAQARNSVAPQPSTFNVDAATGGTFQGRRYTYLIPANAFRTLSGGPVTGNVTVEALDVFAPSEMIFTRIMPVSNGDGLVSGGEIWINASQNGQQLKLASGLPIEVRMPQEGHNAAGMEFFRGTPVPEPTTTIVNWNKRDVSGSIGNVVVAGDTVRLFSDSLGYLNADQFLTNPNYQNYTITVAGVSGVSASQMSGVTIYDQLNGAWPCGNFANGVFTETHVPNIPVHFAAFCVLNGNFYAGVTSMTPATGTNYTVNLTQTTPAAFKARLDAL